MIVAPIHLGHGTRAKEANVGSIEMVCRWHVDSNIAYTQAIKRHAYEDLKIAIEERFCVRAFRLAYILLWHEELQRILVFATSLRGFDCRLLTPGCTWCFLDSPL